MMGEKKVPKGYGYTDIGIVPEDWECVKLKDYIKINSGRSPSEFKFFNNGIPYFKVEQLNNSTKYQKLTPYYIKSDKRIPGGSIIFPKRGVSLFLNKIRILAQDSFMDTNLMTLTVTSNDVNNEFLFYVLVRIGLWKIADITSVPQINKKHINSLVIPKPPISEQQAIAEVLSDIDKLIASLGKLIDKKQKIKQGIIQELLIERKRLSGFSGKWEKKKIGEIADVGRGRVISQKEINSSLEGKYPVYSSQTTNNGIMGYIDTYDYEGEYITWTTDGINAGKVFYRNGKFNCTNVCGTIKLKKDNPKFVAIMLDTVTSKHVSKNLANPKLMNDAMKQIEIELPPLEEQRSIAQIIGDIEDEIESLKRKREKYKAIKQAMMQELLTGRIRLL